MKTAEALIKEVKAQRRLDLATLQMIDAHRSGLRLLDLPKAGLIKWTDYGRLRNFDFSDPDLADVDTENARLIIKRRAGQRITALRLEQEKQTMRVTS